MIYFTLAFGVSGVSYFFFFKQKTAYEMRIIDWSSDVCSSDLDVLDLDRGDRRALERGQKNPAQRIAERQAEAALQRFGDEGRLAPAVARDLDRKSVV